MDDNKINYQEDKRLILPLPQNVNWREENLVFNKDFHCYISNENQDEILLLEEMIKRFTLNKGKAIIKTSTNLKENELVISPCEINESSNDFISLKDEFEYSLNVTKEKALILGDSSIGLKHGFITFLQMLKPSCLTLNEETFTIPCAQIYDKPNMKFRGMHICVFPETELSFVRKTILLAAITKYTHVVLEFWGMLKLDCLAELAWPQAFTKEEIKPIIEEANMMGVEIIPMFNHFGHAACARSIIGRHVVLDQNPDLAMLYEPDGWTYCLSNKETIYLLKEIRKELIEISGKGEYFHIGCDEAHSYATCDNCRDKDKGQMFADFLNDIQADLDTYGRRAIMWGDALLEKEVWSKEEGVISTGLEEHRTYESLEKLNKNIIISDWQYYIFEGKDAKSVSHFQDNGLDVVVSPWYTFDNIATLCKNAKEKNSLGLLLTTWHTLHENMHSIPFAANASYSNRPFYETPKMLGFMAEMLRKLAPSNGEFSNAGWRSHEE